MKRVNQETKRVIKTSDLAPFEITGKISPVFGGFEL